MGFRKVMFTSRQYPSEGFAYDVGRVRHGLTRAYHQRLCLYSSPARIVLKQECGYCATVNLRVLHCIRPARIELLFDCTVLLFTVTFHWMKGEPHETFH